MIQLLKYKKTISFVLFLFFINYLLARFLLEITLSFFTNKGYNILSVDSSLILSTVLKIDLFLVFILLFPLGLYFMGNYLNDVLFSYEKKLYNYLYLSYILGLLGVMFGYFISLNYIIPFFVNYNSSFNISEILTFEFITNNIISMCVLFFILFQLPIVVNILVRTKILKYDFLVKYDNYIIILSLILGALLTPQDLVSMLFVSIPIYLLYRAGLFFSKF